MPRVCVINLSGVSPRLLSRQSGLWVNSLPTPPCAVEATFPAIASSLQASMTTGADPGAHGIVSGGLYRRQCRAVSCSERSNTLLNKKRFWHSRRLPRRVTASLVFWSHPLAGAADFAVGAASYAPWDQANVAQHPTHLYDQLARSLKPCDMSLLWGPTASWRASQWLASAAAQIWKERMPDLQWVSLPGVDFEQVRHGVGSSQAAEALVQVDKLAQRLGQQVIASGGRVVVLSDGGYVPVTRAARPNWLLRQGGLLTLSSGPAGEMIDLEHSRAFCMVDHQIAHLFCADEHAAQEAAAVLGQDPAIARVAPRDEFFSHGLGHDRAGERVVLAATDAWLSYAWWSPDQTPPPVAYRVDPEHKCGYDPCELLAGQESGTIDPTLSGVHASRGRVDVPVADQCFIAASCELANVGHVHDVPAALRELMFETATV